MDAFEGRDKLYSQIVAILSAAPDYYIATNKPMLIGRCLCTRRYCYGTGGTLTGLNMSPKTDHLWNPFKTLPMEKIMVDEKLNALKSKYDKLNSEGKLIRSVKVDLMIHILNKEMTHFEKRIVHNESFEIFEAKLPNIEAELTNIE